MQAINVFAYYAHIMYTAPATAFISIVTRTLFKVNNNVVSAFLFHVIGTLYDDDGDDDCSTEAFCS